jgi:hypothetical protein
VLLADGEIGNVGAVEVVQLVVTEADFIAVKMSKFWRFALSQKSLPWRIILSSSATNSPGMSAARNLHHELMATTALKKLLTFVKILAQTLPVVAEGENAGIAV